MIKVPIVCYDEDYHSVAYFDENYFETLYDAIKWCEKETWRGQTFEIHPKFIPPNKPNWNTAPDFANSLGFSLYTNEGWCWCSGENPSGYKYIEKRK